MLLGWGQVRPPATPCPWASRCPRSKDWEDQCWPRELPEAKPAEHLHPRGRIIIKIKSRVDGRLPRAPPGSQQALNTQPVASPTPSVPPASLPTLLWVRSGLSHVHTREKEGALLGLEQAAPPPAPRGVCSHPCGYTLRQPSSWSLRTGPLQGSLGPGRHPWRSGPAPRGTQEHSEPTSVPLGRGGGGGRGVPFRVPGPQAPATLGTEEGSPRGRPYTPCRWRPVSRLIRKTTPHHRECIAVHGAVPTRLMQSRKQEVPLLGEMLTLPASRQQGGPPVPKGMMGNSVPGEVLSAPPTPHHRSKFHSLCPKSLH